MRNKSLILDNPIFIFKKIHKCPNCNQTIIPKKIKRGVNSKSPESKKFDFSAGDSYLIGDVEFKYYIFYCCCCNKEYEIKEIKNNEREKNEIEIKKKYKNKIIIRIKLFLNKLF